MFQNYPPDPPSNRGQYELSGRGKEKHFYSRSEFKFSLQQLLGRLLQKTQQLCETTCKNLVSLSNTAIFKSFVMYYSMNDFISKNTEIRIPQLYQVEGTNKSYTLDNPNNQSPWQDTFEFINPIQISPIDVEAQLELSKYQNRN